MRKILLTLTTVLLSITFCLAQAIKPDVIVKKDNTKIEALIKEIDDTTIKYKRFSNPDGPQYSISKEEVVTILYANGEVEVMKSTAAGPSLPTNKNIIESNEASNEINKTAPIIYQVPTSLVGFATKIQNGSNDDVRKTLKRYKQSKGRQIFWPVITAGAGVAFIVGGAVTLGNAKSSAIRDSHGRSNSYDEYLSEYRTSGIALITAGVIFGAGSSLMAIAASKNRKRVNIIEAELRRRGETVSFKFSPVLDPVKGTACIRLVGTF